jgi:hypothetical protein
LNKIKLGDITGPFDHNPTRWDELRQTVSIVVDIASVYVLYIISMFMFFSFSISLSFDPDGIGKYHFSRERLIDFSIF